MESRGKKRIQTNKRINLLITVLVCMVISTVVGVVVFRINIGRFKEVTDDITYDKYYVMIAQDSKSSFWNAIYKGAYEKGIEKNAYVELLGDKLSNQYTSEDLMRIAIASRVDGIIVSAGETDEITALIDEAADNNIPVVTLYNDSTRSKRCSFVGVGSYNLGREYGKKVLQIVDEHPMTAAVLVNSDSQDSSQNIFCSGIQETLEKSGKNDITLSLVSVDNTNAFSVEESIRDLFMQDKLPDIIICLNELNTTCVYQAVVDYNKVGQVHILGYYDSETILKAIDRNVIDATASIDALQMGQFCVDALTEYYELGNTSQYFTADIEFIDKKNVVQYMEGKKDDR